MATKMECSICLCDFKNPKIIDCFHTFCKTCLDDYISSKSENGHFPCPICRKDITIPEQFTTNFYLPQQTEVVESTIDDDKGESESRMCGNHMKEIDLYCKRCSVSMCYKCFITDHNGHSVIDLNDFKLEIKTEILALRSELEKTLLKYDQYSESIQHQKKEIETQTSQICSRIDKRVEKLCVALRQIGRGMKDRVTQSHGQEEKEMTSLESLATDLSTRPKHLLKELTADLDYTNVSHLLHLKQELQCQIDHGKLDLIVPQPNINLFQEGEKNIPELTKQIGHISVNKSDPIKKDNIRKSADKSVDQSVLSRPEDAILKFKLNDNKVHYCGESTVITKDGITWWRQAYFINSMLCLGLVLDKWKDSKMPVKISLKIELLNGKDQAKNKVVTAVYDFNRRFDWKDIISRQEMENVPQGYLDDQNKFTFRLHVLHAE